MWGLEKRRSKPFIIETRALKAKSFNSSINVIPKIWLILCLMLSILDQNLLIRYSNTRAELKNQNLKISIVPRYLGLNILFWNFSLEEKLGSNFRPVLLAENWFWVGLRQRQSADFFKKCPLRKFQIYFRSILCSVWITKKLWLVD